MLAWLTFTRSTGHRLYCSDDPTCHYFTFDKSALLRHRQRRHGYKTRSTAPKNRHAKNVPRKCGAPDHKPDSRISYDTECPCLSSSDSRVDETPITNDDRLPIRAAEQPVGPTNTSPEGQAISRFPVSFTRTHFPGVPPLVHPNHGSRYTCKGQNPRTSNRSKGAYSDAISCRPVSIIYRHVESFAKKSFFISPMV